MLGMKELSYNYKLAGRSIPELHARFERALLVYQQGREPTFRGRKLTAEAVVNALVLHWLELPAEAQRQMLMEFVPRFEAMMGEAAPPAAGAVAPPLDPATGEPLKPKRGKGKTG